MKIKIENAAAALKDPDSITLHQARGFREIVYQRTQEIERQLLEIRNPNKPNDRRSHVLSTGSEDDVKALDSEYESLEIWHEQAKAQYKAFQNMEGVCRKREAEAAIPSRLVELDGAADALNEARQALEQAHSDLEAAYSGTTRAYREATGLDNPSADGLKIPDESLADKLIEATKSAQFTPSGPMHNMATKDPNKIGQHLRIRTIEPTP